MSLLWMVCTVYVMDWLSQLKTAVCQVNINIDTRYSEIERWLIDCVLPKYNVLTN